MVDNMSDQVLEKFSNRKSPRLKNYDYTQSSWYFVTICTNEKHCIFGAPDSLSAFGAIAKDAFGEIPKHFPCALVDKYVVMPNHVHAIIAIDQAGTNLSSVIGQYKSYVTKCIHQIAPEFKVWQTSFHDHIIRTKSDYLRIWQYIDTNPVKWAEDCFYPNERLLLLKKPTGVAGS